ncbi:hypothetical protein PAXINDRAFT_101112 [Paxillus involutus ATCC 200175]|uniref:Unplaced genomic scaffold PAXINscaffold_39, whole genome shotgun sequence n=1 Tax=Paxillus involutus ATCC 200175 TaxID=664439 RepID=A0A0C9TYE4_PAXIN|nr:hypothetical protein PAXINDRAFT_101112 [Paxillus involutus ATCC 200175]
MIALEQPDNTILRSECTSLDGQTVTMDPDYSQQGCRVPMQPAVVPGSMALKDGTRRSARRKSTKRRSRPAVARLRGAIDQSRSPLLGSL